MRFRKLPVEIEATCNRGDWASIVAWMEEIGPGGLAFEPGTPAPIERNEDGSLDIHTREGTMRADVGDWIIRGVKGEFYPCKPDIFGATYEPAEAQ